MLEKAEVGLLDAEIEQVETEKAGVDEKEMGGWVGLEERAAELL